MTPSSDGAADSTVFTWGAGGLGRLGHGEDVSDQTLPKKIEVWAIRPSTPASSDGSEEDE